jgi:hypothetical protein
MNRTIALALLLVAVPAFAQPKADGKYVKKDTRGETAAATLSSFGLPTLQGTWRFAGPFDNTDKKGFDAAYPPEKEVDLKATYTGKGGAKFGWAEYKKFALGQVLDLAPLCPKSPYDAVVYLYHEFEATDEVKLPLSLGSDDTLSVWFNGERLIHEAYERPAAADQDIVTLKVKKGTNKLLLKIGQMGGGWQVYVCPLLPDSLPKEVKAAFAKDFPAGIGAGAKPGNNTAVGDEPKYYPVTTFPLPKDCVLEADGLHPPRRDVAGEQPRIRDAE